MKKKLTLLLAILFIAGCSKNTSTTVDDQTQRQPEEKKVIEKQVQGKKFEGLAAEYQYAILKTNFGDIQLAFYGADSPKTVNNFLQLAQNDFYDRIKFHRVINDFMIQSGDPNSKDDDWSDDGTGDPGYKFEDEFNSHKLVRGSLAMANSGPNTNGSQFFIVTAEATPWLDGKHTNFGYVLVGMDVVDKIEAVEKNNRDHPIEDVIIEDVELVK
jgi:peptidyl-prolyl cis-trans isomerase B (cyclophilin B)